jgi:hypothetical protein
MEHYELELTHDPMADDYNCWTATIIVPSESERGHEITRTGANRHDAIAKAGFELEWETSNWQEPGTIHFTN